MFLPVALTTAALALTAVDAAAVWRQPEPAPPAIQLAPWSPPVWLSGELAWALPALDGPARHTSRSGAPTVRARGGPVVRARGAILADLDRGEILWARNPDVRRGVASVTKVVSALTWVSQVQSPDLLARHCVDYELWPSRPGAMSRFSTGDCPTAAELVGAALVHSDNRGAMAFPVLSDLPYDAFLREMNEVSAQLGMNAEWHDPTGLLDDNQASPRAMLKAIVAAASTPLLADLTTAPVWAIDRDGGKLPLGSTNRLRERWETLAAKTGYTDTAGYCFATVLRTDDGRTLAAVVLGSPTEQSRFDDTRRMVEWAEAR
jgi:D-alanyl-D-alanine carboxypeptidase